MRQNRAVRPQVPKSVIAVGDTVFCSHPSGHTRENGMLSVGKLRRKKGGYTHVDWVRHVSINRGFFAYSCLAQIDAHTLGCTLRGPTLQPYSVSNL